MVTAAVCAVLSGYRSYAAIGDVPATTALALGVTPDPRPSEAMSVGCCRPWTRSS